MAWSLDKNRFTIADAWRIDIARDSSLSLEGAGSIPTVTTNNITFFHDFVNRCGTCTMGLRAQRTVSWWISSWRRAQGSSSLATYKADIALWCMWTSPPSTTPHLSTSPAVGYSGLPRYWSHPRSCRLNLQFSFEVCFSLTSNIMFLLSCLFFLILESETIQGKLITN